MTLHDFLRILIRPEVILSVAAPVVGVLYAVGEYSGTWDRLSGREQAMAGLRRLETATGYPHSFVFARGTDGRVFDALFRRVRQLVSRETASALRQAGLKPLLITVGGQPMQLSGLPQEWEQKDRAYYSSGHPVLVVYGSHVDDHGSISDGKAERVCSVGELTDQLEREKANWRFYVGTLMTALLSVALIILRFAMKVAEH